MTDGRRALIRQAATNSGWRPETADRMLRIGLRMPADAPIPEPVRQQVREIGKLLDWGCVDDADVIIDQLMEDDDAED